MVLRRRKRMESSLFFCRLNKISCTFSVFVVKPVFHYYFAVEIIFLILKDFFFFPSLPPQGGDDGKSSYFAWLAEMKYKEFWTSDLFTLLPLL